ncbi:hypothetical protein [Clostridium ganghwense]|uniref:Nucleoside phosphorylase domain-containing protein n=1 Tax=Clostridium ganghwense TaxID=312089 RepID=A0ABT4CNC3_9CLOT|nr:hypothetical protein [Clostridium ganghwense]MCY6369586.1 hypothetical protein [Clostridium ganghwense]
MIYICAAMYCEVSPFISYLGLKKDNEVTSFQVFKNDETVLIISGVGSVASAIATTYMLTKYKAEPYDLFINIGICGTKKQEIEIGNTILCHKIINHDTKKKFYPDILFKHPFEEGVLETFSTIINREMYCEFEGDLVDMEGAGAYAAAAIFLPPHQINCIKIVSDFLEGDKVTSKKVSELVGDNVPLISKWMKERQKSCCQPSKIFTEEEVNFLKKISNNLRLTESMYHQLNQLSKHYKIRFGNILEVSKPFLHIQCKSKNEGKRYFAKLKEQLMEF